jgi:cellulose synthase/poly-beta-1,6-N-acetylglucosamine synthase-like glycosyltransferase
LNRFSENLLKQYTLNDIDTKHHDILVVYDNFLEQSVAEIQLNDTVEFLSRINNLFYNTISVFNIIEDPQLKSKEIIKNTGFFIGNNTNAYGQVITKNVDDQLLIKIEAFSIDYNKNDYVSIPSTFNSVGPQLSLCLENNSQCITPSNSELKTNAGDNLYMLHNVDIDGDNLDNYRIILHDEKDVLAYIPLKEYGIARISLDSFIDWMQHYLPVFPFIALILIFPITFDYIRSIFKLLFFPILWLSKKSENNLSHRNTNKKVTILIPAHNEEFGIRESIESAIATDYTNKEIIVIDDGSKDDTYLIAYKFAEKGLIKLIHRDTASGSKATALNYGANYATGDYIVCMDGDTRLDKNALKNSIPHFDDEDVVALSGNVKIVSGDDGVNNTVTNLQKYEYMVAIELGRRFTSFFGILLVISGAFGIFKKNLFRDVRTFDNDTLTEDFDLTLKFRKTKGVIRFVGNSIAYTYCPNTFSVWIRQRNRWAHGQFQTLLKNKNILTSKFSFRDKISFLDMFVLDVLLALMFPVGLVVLGIISVTLYFEDNLHILVYPLLFAMISFLILEVLIFLYAVGHSQQGKSSSIKLIYLAPVMTFFYRPYLKMINLRGYVRAYFKRQSSW